MQGTSLLEIETAAGGWRAVTVLDRAVQADFFAGRSVSQSHQREPAMAALGSRLAERTALFEPFVQLTALFRRQLADAFAEQRRPGARATLASACTTPRAPR